MLSDQKFDARCDLKQMMKLGCMSIVVIFVLLMAIGVIVGGDESEDREVAADEVRFKIGDRVTLGDYAYTVHRSYSTATIGKPEFWGESAGVGAVFIIVEYTIENLTNETQTVLADDFTLIDSRDRSFSSSSDATTALLQEDGQDFILSELQPGLPQRTKTAFKIPTEAKNGKLRVLIPEKGFFSSGEAIVELN